VAKFKVEIEKILERGVCPFGYKAGDLFEFDLTDRMATFPNFCGWAYHDMFPTLVALKYGAQFPFGHGRNTVKITCTDSNNPVVFRISLIE
jgi:uncharacterized repeat protein (TIGR04076 family)